MQVARFQACKLGDVVSLNVFDVVAGFLQDLSHELGRDQLAGPVMKCQLDRIAGFGCERRRDGQHSGQCQ